MTKRIIDGKRYDTSSADLVAHFRNGYSRDDFKWLEEELYRTPKGAWFTYGGGGPGSKYCNFAPGEREASIGQTDVITPMTSDEAMRWLENAGETELLEEFFGQDITDA
jgi:hypothetical protein